MVACLCWNRGSFSRGMENGRGVRPIEGYSQLIVTAVFGAQLIALAVSSGSLSFCDAQRPARFLNSVKLTWVVQVGWRVRLWGWAAELYRSPDSVSCVDAVSSSGRGLSAFLEEESEKRHATVEDGKLVTKLTTTQHQSAWR